MFLLALICKQYLYPGNMILLIGCFIYFCVSCVSLGFVNFFLLCIVFPTLLLVSSSICISIIFIHLSISLFIHFHHLSFRRLNRWTFSKISQSIVIYLHSISSNYLFRYPSSPNYSKTLSIIYFSSSQYFPRQTYTETRRETQTSWQISSSFVSLNRMIMELVNCQRLTARELFQ